MKPWGVTWGRSGEASRGQGFRTEDMEVNITFREEKNKGREVKEQPTWMTESTVTAATEMGSSMGPSLGLVTQKADMEELEGNDEITEMLLRNEGINKDKAGIVTPWDDSFTNSEREEGEMENDSDENDDIRGL